MGCSWGGWQKGEFVAGRCVVGVTAMREYDLTTSFSRSGVFQNPEAEADSVEGQLAFEPSASLSATLYRGFARPPWNYSPVGEKNEFLLGKLVNGDLVTLLDSFVTNCEMGAGASGPTTLCVNGVLIGAHAHDLSLPAISCIHLRFSSGECWASEHPFKLEPIVTADGEINQQFAYKSGLLLDTTVQEPSMRFQIVPGLYTSFTLSEASLSHSSRWRIRPTTPVTLETARALAWRCQMLFSLLVGRGMPVRECSYEIAPDTWQTSSPDMRAHALYVQRVKDTKESIFSAEMVLPFPSCKDYFPQLVSNWFKLSARATSAVNIFFSTLASPPPVQDLRVLVFMQAIEALHRASWPGTYLAQDRYDAMLPNMLALIPDDLDPSHRQALKSRLKFGNEYSLRKRLSEIMKLLPSKVSETLTQNAPGFIDRVVATRNYLTHYDESSSENVYRDRQLYFVAERLKWLFISVVLTLLEVPSDRIETALTSLPEARHSLSSAL
jgi:ApeA N-terminal domain 1